MMIKALASALGIAALCVSSAAQPNDGETLYRRSREALLRGEAEHAVTLLEKAVALNPDRAPYHYRLGAAYGQAASAAGMFGAVAKGRKAKDALERAIALDPNLLAARMALLEFHVMAPAVVGGDRSAATVQASEIRKRDPIEGYRAFARLHTASDRPDLARAEYVEMLKRHSSSARAHYLFAVFLMLTEKNYPSAREELEAALKLDRAFMPAYFRLGHLAALTATGSSRGKEALAKYLAHHPDEDEPSLARAHYWLGTIHEKEGRKAEARVSYAASMKINPNQKDVQSAINRCR